MNEINAKGAFFDKQIATKKNITDAQSWNLWECEPPSYSHDYDRDVILYVVEGLAVLTFSNGEAVAVSAGDLVNIKKGISAHWRIERHMRNLYKYLD